MYNPIPNYYPYAISKQGEIINLKTNYILRPEVLKKGYLRVKLCFGINKRFLVHRLVAMTYIPNPNNLPQINHKDGNKQNNSVTNLEWCNNDYNRDHAIKNGLWDNIGKKVLENCEDPGKKSAAKLCKEEVLQIINKLNSGFSTRELADEYNLHISTIRNIKTGKSWNHITNII